MIRLAGGAAVVAPVAVVVGTLELGWEEGMEKGGGMTVGGGGPVARPAGVKMALY